MSPKIGNSSQERFVDFENSDSTNLVTTNETLLILKILDILDVLEVSFFL